MKESSAKRRRRLIQKYACLYFYFKSSLTWREHSCIYCGNVSEENDHVPPLSWIDVFGVAYFDRKGIPFILVPSCRECNRELHDKRLFTLRERILYLIGRYSKKYARMLEGVVWTDAEIDELRGRLKQSVEGFQTVQIGIDRRIGILEAFVREDDATRH